MNDLSVTNDTHHISGGELTATGTSEWDAIASQLPKGQKVVITKNVETTHTIERQDVAEDQSHIIEKQKSMLSFGFKCLSVCFLSLVAIAAFNILA